MRAKVSILGPLFLACVVTLTSPAAGQGTAERPVPARPAEPRSPSRASLTPEQWEQLGRCTDRALNWLAQRQAADGAFPSLEQAQPGVTALCLLAFLSRGHLPGQGRHGRVMDQGLDFVLDCRQSDGLLARLYPHPPHLPNNQTHTAIYNHATAGLLLSEVYGMTTGELNRRVRQAIPPAIDYSRKRQLDPKQQAGDGGGWRYVKRWPVSDSDLSVTSWQLMFLRSARNAGFDVPPRYIDEALTYVGRCFLPQQNEFLYALYGENRHTSRAMTGAGILALSMAGLHQSEPAQRAGRWVLDHPFDQFNARLTFHDRFFYGAFYCSQGMFQLGGDYWTRFYPTLLRTLTANQRPDGSWDAEDGLDLDYGNVYSTAMATLALTVPYQLLPIFQR